MRGGLWFLAPFIVFCALGLPAAVKPGENIVLNGKLQADQLVVPQFWVVYPESAAGRQAVAVSSGGPNGSAYMHFTSESADKPLSISFRQQELTIAPAGRYRMSCKVRVKNFSSAKPPRLLFVNTRWRQEAGLTLSGGTEEWKEFSGEAVGFASDGYHDILLLLQSFTGEFDLADVRLEALDETALSGSSPTAAAQMLREPRLVPWGRLFEIPSASRRAVFRFFGELPEGVCAEDLAVELEVDGRQSVTAFSVDAPMALGLPSGVTAGRMSVRLVRKSGGCAIVSNEYLFRVADRPPVDTTGHRRLNNLVTEILRCRISGKKPLDCSFSCARDGWVWLRFASVEKKAFFARLDGFDVVDSAKLRHGVFRELKAGGHVLSVSEFPEGEVVVRQVPAIFNYPPCAKSPMSCNPDYGWEYFKRHVMPYTNVQNGGRIPPEHFVEFRDWGGKNTANINVHGLKDGTDFVNRILSSDQFVQPYFDGISCDELYFGSPVALGVYTDGLKKFALLGRSDRPMASWIVGKPSNPGLDEEFIASAISVSGGKGLLYSEVYGKTQPTEEMARTYVREYVRGTVESFQSCHPESVRSLGIIFGNFNQMLRISIDHYPEVDPKRFLDLEVNFLANDPSCRDIACTGYWGSYYADDEMHRWSMELMRHYCIEGNTNLLSDVCGYPYLPGHLDNGDFREGLKGWTTEGIVRADRVSGLGVKVERRWYAAGGLGDAFATLVRTTDGKTALSQRLKGLMPGRKYVLQLVCFDVKDAKEEVLASKEIKLGVTLSSGARPDYARSWNYVQDAKGRKSKIAPLCNLRHLVFMADSTEINLKLDVDACPDGAEIGVNAISLRPYHE